MKRLLLAAALALCASPANAASPYDGAYACTGYVPALNYGFTAYSVFLSHPDGTAAASILAPVPTGAQLYGYSFGTLSGNVYTGTSGINGQTSTVTFGANGTYTTAGEFIYAGVTYTDTVTCSKVF